MEPAADFAKYNSNLLAAISTQSSKLDRASPMGCRLIACDTGVERN
jgi:hypothetical protein